MGRTLLLTCAVAAAIVVHERPCRAAPPFAITPAWTHAFGPRSVTGDALGLDLQVLFGKTQRFGVGLTGALYSPLPQATTGTPSTPTTEMLGSFLAEFGWTALRGERAELTVVGGVGEVSSRPVSVVDPAHRTFSYAAHVAMSSGVIARVYLTRAMALSLEARHVVYVESLESTQVDARAPRDASTWFGDRPLTPLIETRAGLTILLPSREP
jgi:hypothetical protein